MAISDPAHDAVPQASPASPAFLERPAESSVHPKKRGWLWVVVILALAGGGYVYYRSRGPFAGKAAAANPGTRGGGAMPVSVAVTPAIKQDVPYYLTGLGSVTPFNTVTVKSRVDGQLEKVFFTEGQFVHQGDLLAQIDPRPFQVALQQMQGQMARDQAQLNNARVDFARYDTLHKEGVVAQQQVDTHQASVGQLEGALRADQAQIDAQKLQLTYSRITAPISGRVGLRLVDQGNIVHAADPNGLVVITQVQPIAALFTLPEDSLQEVIRHMRKEELAIQAYSRDDQVQLATGKLVTIDNQIDASTGTVRFKGVFDNRDLSLWPNQFVNVRLMLAVRSNAIVVPLAAIQRGTQGTYVYTVTNKHAEMKPVTVDLTQGNFSVVSHGLAEGDQVVVDGQDKLQAGTPVETHTTAPPAAANAPANGSPAGSPVGSNDLGNPLAAPDGAGHAGSAAKHVPPSSPTSTETRKP